MWGMGWIDQAQDRDRWKALVNVVTNVWVTYNAESFLRSWGTVSFSRRILPQLATVSKQKINILPEDGTKQTKIYNGYEQVKEFFIRIVVCDWTLTNTPRHTYQQTTMYWSYHTLTSDYDFPHLLVRVTTTFTVFIACHLLQMCPCLNYCQLSQMSRSVAVHTSYRRYKALGVLLLFFNLCTAAFKACCAIWVRRSQLLPPGVTTRELPAVEGRTVGEKCLGILPKCQITRYI
jgi:hypothetical protein